MASFGLSTAVSAGLLPQDERRIALVAIAVSMCFIIYMCCLVDSNLNVNANPNANLNFNANLNVNLLRPQDARTEGSNSNLNANLNV